MIISLFGSLISVLVFCCCGYYGFIPAALTILFSLLPIEGYYSKHCTTISLLKLRSTLLFDKYVIKEKNKATCAFNNKDKYGIKGVAYEELVVKGKITVYEDANCETPILKIYTQKPKSEGLTFAPSCFFTKREYVFYVPEGSVKYRG